MRQPLQIVRQCNGQTRLFRPLSLRHACILRTYTRPSFAPKPTLDLRHIRLNPGLYEQNCLDRNYTPYAKNGWKILELHERLVEEQKQVADLRKRNNALGKALAQNSQKSSGNDNNVDAAAQREALHEEGKKIKVKLSEFERLEKSMQEEMERLAWELPNLSSQHTPNGDDASLLGHVGQRPSPKIESAMSHVDIGKDLDILDFEASATTSGWGWYFLKNEAALLEQALIQFALSVAMKRGWQVMTPPSLVYSHIASACGFMPRDTNGETQIYPIAQSAEDGESGKPSLVLAGTAEIPFAGSKANTTFKSTALPLKIIGHSRCYRAEAGARGVGTKGLYRVHEFTKVEMFAWTLPASKTTNRFDDLEATKSQAETVFDEMVEIQKEILSSLGLHARILEMPSTDLGASASRKIDIEAFFPSRLAIDEGYGEVTSASICGDYQSRRLATRVKTPSTGGSDSVSAFPETVNGTAMAIPRILAALLENQWDQKARAVTIPECLRRYMPGEARQIGPGNR